MPEWIAVCCAQCGTYQAIQKPKPTGARNPTRKFGCRMCQKKQSIIKTFAISEQASDIRGVVQSLNAKRADREQNNEQRVLAQLRDRPQRYERSDDEEDDDYHSDDDDGNNQAVQNKRRRYNDSDSDSSIERVFQSRKSTTASSSYIPDHDQDDQETAFNPFDSPPHEEEPNSNITSRTAHHPAVHFQMPHEQRAASFQSSHNQMQTRTPQSHQSQTQHLSTHVTVANNATDLSSRSSQHVHHRNQLLDEAELDDLLQEAETLF